jgi:hypothetical protein
VVTLSFPVCCAVIWLALLACWLLLRAERKSTTEGGEEMSTDTNTEAAARDLADAAESAVKAGDITLDEAKGALAQLALTALSVALDPASTAADAKAAAEAMTEVCEALELLDADQAKLDQPEPVMV